ncbi:methyl-accepting chemotaxis protein [Chitinilyticum litopenaei]|uniref:methyl-accepting chemotaxis protein n=1 Tax=Chitinilyticum litopenaei TaxID=1121276 RepID=UPI00040780DE
MNWFRNLRVGSKLVLAFLLVAGMGGLIGALGIRSLAEINQMTERIYTKDLLGINAIHEAKEAQLNVGRAYRTLALAVTAEERSAALAEVQQAREELAAKMQVARGLYTTEKGQQMLRDFDAVAREFDVALDEFLRVQQGQPLQASSTAHELMNGKLAEHGKGMRDRIDALVTLKVDWADMVYGEANTLYANSRNWLLAAVVLGVVLGIALGLLIARSITRPLGSAVTLANALAEGRLDDQVSVNSRDETGQLLAAMQRMQAATRRIIDDIRQLVGAAEQGDFSRTIDVSQHKGYAVELGQSLNALSETTRAGLQDITRVANALAAGDLGQQIERPYPGVFGEARAGVNGTVAALRSIVGDIEATVEAAAKRGDFSRRMALEGRQGYTLTLAQLLNQLSATSEDGLNDVNRVVQALARGDLSQQIDKDYPGAFGRTGQAVNGTVAALQALIADIQNVVDAAANRGDFSHRLPVAGRAGFMLELAGLLNKLSDTTEAGLKDVNRVAAALAAGDLTERIDTDYAGLFDETRRGINGTVEHLQQLVGEIIAASEAINGAASEIAQGNLDLSRRTEAQAASLEETASSMEELTSTVKQNADNAQQANQFAIGAREVAGKGGTVVGQVVGTMSDISAASKKIADIISVIDGIAFQTNILALNAAVEAARAGEQGRGFAVVAGEVRTLAQRSAAAAKEIKTLINDSVEQVAAGSLLVNEAGETMQDIESSVRRVTDIMSEISAASQEQSAGIAQINQAVTQMDEATQQNAALVEEAAAAAAALKEQAQMLSQAVSVFRLAKQPAVSLAAPRVSSGANPTRAAAGAPAPRKAVNKTAAKPQARAPGAGKPAGKAAARTTAGAEEEWEEF